LRRLAGLETEYAIRFRGHDPALPPTARFQLYRGLLQALERRIPGVPAKHFKEGVFTATGGAVWYEAERTTVDAGMIEGATPECRGPRVLLAYQRAQDRLLAEAAANTFAGGEFTLLKNDRDAFGNIYGAQENYEAVVARGWRLAAWRVGLVLILLPAAIAWLSLVIMVILTFLYFLVASVALRIVEAIVGEQPRWSRWWIATQWEDGRLKPNAAPAWLELLLYYATHLVTAPLTASLYALCQLAAFQPQRRDLVPFLLSRAVIGGAGTLDREDRYWLADKAPAVNCVMGFGSLLLRRPIFNFGHFLKSLCIETLMSPRDYLDLFGVRQRMQVSLGDSNLAETAEYLRIATTMLVLDASEAGALRAIPRFRQPIRALHAWCADATLTTQVLDTEGRAWTAVGLQEFYCRACEEFLRGLPHVPDEALEVVQRWRSVLHDLVTDPGALMGQIDWVTKKYLLDEAGRDASWEARKKIDLRYHELSSRGYFAQLDEAGHAARILTEEEVERAMRSAPPDSPATTRGHYIREFSRTDEPLAANWKKVILGQGRNAKVIRLARYGRKHDE